MCLRWLYSFEKHNEEQIFWHMDMDPAWAIEFKHIIHIPASVTKHFTVSVTKEDSPGPVLWKQLHPQIGLLRELHYPHVHRHRCLFLSLLSMSTLSAEASGNYFRKPELLCLIRLNWTVTWFRVGIKWNRQLQFISLFQYRHVFLNYHDRLNKNQSLLSSHVNPGGNANTANNNEELF